MSNDMPTKKKNMSNPRIMPPPPYLSEKQPHRQNITVRGDEKRLARRLMVEVICLYVPHISCAGENRCQVSVAQLTSRKHTHTHMEMIHIQHSTSDSPPDHMFSFNCKIHLPQQRHEASNINQNVNQNNEPTTKDAPLLEFLLVFSILLHQNLGHGMFTSHGYFDENSWDRAIMGHPQRRNTCSTLWRHC